MVSMSPPPRDTLRARRKVRTVTHCTTAPGSEVDSRLSGLSYALTRGPALARLRLAMAAHVLRSLQLHRDCGYVTLCDYVRERLDRRLSTFYDWSDAGRLFTAVPAARREFRRGGLPLSSAVLLSRRSFDEATALLPLALRVSTGDLRAVLAGPPDPDEPGPAKTSVAKVFESKTSDTKTPESNPPDDEDRHLVRVQVRLPRSAAVYCEETLELAHALCGEDASPAEALAAILAEASTEVPFGSNEGFRVPCCAKVIGERSTSRNEAPRDWPSLAAPRDRTRLAHRLDAICRAALAQLDAWQARAEDLLLDCSHHGDHLTQGDPNFFHFVVVTFELPRSTAAEMLQRARLRRIQHPLDIARAEGRLGPIKETVLRTLASLGVPRSAFEAWIECATRTTVRMLKRMVATARRFAAADLRAWALRDFAPPSEAEVRTSETPLSELAAEPRLPTGETLAHEPHHTLRWELAREDHLLLMEMARHLHVHRAPAWWPVVRIFHLAREAWRRVARPHRRHPHHRVLERDRYQCQVPGCSKRAVEGHHIQFRSRGGGDEAENLLATCPSHHRHGVHAGRLRIEGRVTDDRGQLRFDLGLDGDGQALVSYQGETLCTRN